MTKEEQHVKLRDERRELEAEMAVINDQLREAIDNGDLVALDRLTNRKSELPKLFISASTAETTARRELFKAEDEANLKTLAAAEAQCDKAKRAFEKRQKEVEAELAEMKNKIEEAEAQVSEAYNAIAGSRELGASGDAGFRRALAAVGS